MSRAEHRNHYDRHFDLKRGGVAPQLGHEEPHYAHRPHHLDDRDDRDDDIPHASGYGDHGEAPPPRRRRKRKAELKAHGRRSRPRADRMRHTEHHTTVTLHHSVIAPHRASGGEVGEGGIAGLLGAVAEHMLDHAKKHERKHEDPCEGDDPPEDCGEEEEDED